MANETLLLGPVQFRGTEIPPRIRFGGAQRLVVHKLPGGARVIDALGRNDAAITWSGVFSGPDATLRARLIDELRAAGTPLPLVWSVFFYTVMIGGFTADFTKPGWIPYTLTCTVLRDEAAALVDIAPSLAAGAADDMANAAAFTAGLPIDLSAAQAALAQPGATTRGGAAYGTALAQVNAAKSATASASATAESALENTQLSTNDPAGAIASLGAAVSAAQQAAGLRAALGFLRRTAANLSNAST